MDSPHKLKVRANIKLLVKLGWKKSEIIENVKKVYGDKAPKKTTIYAWISRFESGREDLVDDSRSGRPSTSINEDNVKGIKALVEDDPRVSVEIISLTQKLSVGSVHNILKEKLGLSKINGRWVPKQLSEEQLSTRADTSIQILNRWDADYNDFLQRIVTGDEIWIYQYDPESKKQSELNQNSIACGPYKEKPEKPTAKILATIFWDSQGVLLVDFVENRELLNPSYRAEILQRLHSEVAKKRPGKLYSRVLFHRDNSGSNSNKLVRSTLRECRWELLNHPPYSPDLAPSDFFLFPNLRKKVQGIKFSTVTEVQTSVINWFDSKDPEFYRNGLESWYQRLQRCCDLDGAYLEK